MDTGSIALSTALGGECGPCPNGEEWTPAVSHQAASSTWSPAAERSSPEELIKSHLAADTLVSLVKSGLRTARDNTRRLPESRRSKLHGKQGSGLHKPPA